MWSLNAGPSNQSPRFTVKGHGAMSHYEDPTEIPAPSEEDCPKTNPDTGSRFDLWHPDIGWMLHVWLFEENPARIFAPFNPNIP